MAVKEVNPGLMYFYLCYSDQIIGRKDIIYMKEIQMNYFLESFLTEY